MVVAMGQMVDAMAIIRQAKAEIPLQGSLTLVLGGQGRGPTRLRNKQIWAYLAYVGDGVRLEEALAHAGKVELENAAIRGNKIQVSDDTLPHAGKLREAGVGAVAFEADEIKMPYHGGLGGLQHGELCIKITLKELLISPASLPASVFVHGSIVVDGDRVHMMDRAYKQVIRMCRDALVDELQRLGPDPIAFEPDWQLNLASVFLSKQRRLGHICPFILQHRAQRRPCTHFFGVPVNVVPRHVLRQCQCLHSPGNRRLNDAFE